jgi:hypothetical protein
MKFLLVIFRIDKQSSEFLGYLDTEFEKNICLAYLDIPFRKWSV